MVPTASSTTARPSARSFDAIVIGSGMGGLAFASVMARMRKWRVLVLDRHFKIGGFTHTFSRPGGWTWDVGIHYVGEMGPGTLSRRLFDFITDGGVDWAPLPDVYDVFVYPGLTVKVPTGRGNFQRTLSEAFPSETQAIHEYFRDTKRAANWFSRRVVSMVAPWPISAIAKLINRCSEPIAVQTTREYLDSHIHDPRLRAVLVSQWVDYGLPPSRSAFVTHSVIASHYFEGAWYPVGGAGEIAKATGSLIQAAGGELLADHEVTRIILERGRAVGVEVRSKKRMTGAHLEFRAPVIVSDAGAWNTFTKLMPAKASPIRSELDPAPDGLEVVELFLGLKRNPREAGFQGENYWIFSSFDHEEMCARRDDAIGGRASMVYLSFPSLKDPRARQHTAEIIAPFSFRLLEDFRREPWKRRGPNYEAAKSRITQALLDLVDCHRHGFRDLVAYAELATPLTFEYFTAAPSGTIYGYPGTPDRYRKSWLAPRTHIPNLYLTGADAVLFGVMGALMGGVATASVVLGPTGFIEIMRAAWRYRAETSRLKRILA